MYSRKVLAYYLIGLSFLSNAQHPNTNDDKDRTVDMPLDRQIRLGTGTQYDWNENVTVGGAYTYIDLGDAEIDQKGGPLQGNIKGDYKTNHVHTLALNLIWRF